MLVRAPIDPRRFNGTVLVEWLNVSVGRDVDVETSSRTASRSPRGA
jgi:hypothetical protein